MKKKGQLTLFVIIGVIVILTAIVGLWLISDIDFKEATYPSFMNPVKTKVETCTERLINDGLEFICLQGGYYDAPADSEEQLFFSVPYYFFNGKSNVPSKDIIEEELSKYIEDNLVSCVDIEEIRESGLEINNPDVKVKANIDRSVEVKIEFPLTVTKGDVSSKMSNFVVEEGLDFNQIYNVVVEFEEEHQNNPNYVPIGFVSILAKEKGFTYELRYLDEATVMYSLVFPIDESRNLVYNFLGKYEWDLDVPKKEITIIPIPRMTAYEGQLFEYEVTIKEKKRVIYSSFTTLFSISSEGKISFTPDSEDSGRHEILIKAEDSRGNEDTYVMILDIDKDLSGGLNG